MKRVKGMNKLISVLSLLIVLSFLVGCGSAGDGVVVAGSTSVQPYIEILAEDYAHINPEIEIYVQGGGSAAGITAAENETADLGMSSRGLKEEEEWLWSLEIAKDGLAMIIHPQNPVSELSLSELQKIYTGQITNWSEVNGPDHRIHVIAREEGSGTRSAFESLVMGDMEISPKSIVQASNGAVKQLVADDKYSIGFISLGLIDEKVKTIALDNIAPTKENVINGSYTLSRPFLLVAYEEPIGEVKEFVDFIMSPVGQKILADEGLIVQIGESQ